MQLFGKLGIHTYRLSKTNEQKNAKLCNYYNSPRTFRSSFIPEMQQSLSSPALSFSLPLSLSLSHSLLSSHISRLARSLTFISTRVWYGKICKRKICRSRVLVGGCERARAERLGRYLKKPKLGSSVFVVFGFRGSLVSSLGEALRVSLVYMSS